MPDVLALEYLTSIKCIVLVINWHSSLYYDSCRARANIVHTCICRARANVCGTFHTICNLITLYSLVMFMSNSRSFLTLYPFLSFRNILNSLLSRGKSTVFILLSFAFSSYQLFIKFSFI